MIDWSRIRSHSSFIQSFLLSNTIDWQLLNAWLSNWMDMREGRFINLNDTYRLNESTPILISFNWSQFIITQLLPILLLSSREKLQFPMIILFSSFNPLITNRFTFTKQSHPIISLSISRSFTITKRWSRINTLSFPFKQSVSNTFKSFP